MSAEYGSKSNTCPELVRIVPNHFTEHMYVPPWDDPFSRLGQEIHGLVYKHSGSLIPIPSPDLVFVFHTPPVSLPPPHNSFFNVQYADARNRLGIRESFNSLTHILHFSPQLSSITQTAGHVIRHCHLPSTDG